MAPGNLLSWLGKADTAVFKFINITLHNDLLAFLMRLSANDVFLVLVLAAGFCLLFRGAKERWKRPLAAALWAVIAGNVISGYLLKPLFKRPRPFTVVEGANLLSWASSKSYAFPSTHTVMATALATALWADHPEARPYLALFIFFVAFFCVYTGGHYPGDVLAGAVVGWAVGAGARFIFKSQKPEGKSQK